jgi:hypothetical protein
MKYLRRIFESLDRKGELQDLCDSYFAYLYDEGFEVKIAKDVVVWTIIINKPNTDGPAYYFSWDEVKDYLIPFFEKLLITEDLFTNQVIRTGILLKYIKPKHIYDNTWYKYPSAYDTKIFQPTRRQIINDEIINVPSTIHHNWNCMEYLYEINIMIKE